MHVKRGKLQEDMGFPAVNSQPMLMSVRRG